MRKWFYLLLAMVILAAAIPLTGCSKSESEEPYKIGALFAVTGGNAPLGEPEKQTVGDDGRGDQCQWRHKRTSR